MGPVHTLLSPKTLDDPQTLGSTITRWPRALPQTNGVGLLSYFLRDRRPYYVTLWAGKILLLIFFY